MTEHYLPKSPDTHSATLDQTDSSQCGLPKRWSHRTLILSVLTKYELKESILVTIHEVLLQCLAIPHRRSQPRLC